MHFCVMQYADFQNQLLGSALKHCVKSVRIRSYSGPYFPTFGLNTEGYSLSLRIQSEHGKIRTRITPNTDTFYALKVLTKSLKTFFDEVHFIVSLFYQNSIRKYEDDLD